MNTPTHSFSLSTLLGIFKINKKILQRSTPAELRQRLNKNTPEEFLKFCEKNKPDLLEPCPTDGKSTMDIIHEKINADMVLHQEKISAYRQKNADIFTIAKNLRQEISPIELEQNTRRTVPIFYSEELLKKLDIPKSAWPNIVLTPQILAQAQEIKPYSIYDETDHVDFLERLCAVQKENHEKDTTPCEDKNRDIIERLLKQKTEISELKSLQEGVFKYANTIACFWATEKKPVKLFIDCMKEPKFLEACPWMKDYKPDEKAFLSKIYDEWEKHANDLLRFQDNFKEAVMSEDKETAYLRSYGFYDWQPERDPTKNIAVSKLTI